MKIRMDFVTNSSSESWGEIVIDNPVLLEMLARYKEMGLITEDGASCYAIGNLHERSELPDTLHFLEPTLNILDFSWSMIPENLEMVLEYLFYIMGDARSNGELEKELYEQFKIEIEQKKDEINQAYNAVYWIYEEYRYSGVEMHALFTYDKTEGEKYSYERDGDDDDWGDW